MKTFHADLHVHTVLSPCAEVEMIPPLIVQKALEMNINLIAITDHNATGNINAVMEAAQGTDLTVLPGMELQTREEVHLLCLFDTLEQAETWQKVVDSILPKLSNNSDFFGEQYIVDASGEFIRHEERLLIVSAQIGLDEAAEQVHAFGGFAIPAHVDRKAFSLIANLGLVPPGFEALEISRHLKPTEAAVRYPQIRGYPLIQSGDVHRLDEFLGVCEFHIEAPTLSEIRKALKGTADRSFFIRTSANVS
jgi:3',5'-nucleoside bisphosphate phosphatase